MPITFHCEHCGKRIETSENMAGKWGKCPACHNKLYVPNLSPDEDLKLAPIDESDEERQRQLMAETHEFTQDILQEREAPNGANEAGPLTSEISDRELTKRIIDYLLQMADSELDQAQKTADLIVPYHTRAMEVLDRIAVSDMPEPELAHIRPHVLSGLIRSLRAKLS